MPTQLFPSTVFCRRQKSKRMVRNGRVGDLVRSWVLARYVVEVTSIIVHRIIDNCSQNDQWLFEKLSIISIILHARLRISHIVVTTSFPLRKVIQQKKSHLLNVYLKNCNVAVDGNTATVEIPNMYCGRDSCWDSRWMALLVYLVTETWKMKLKIQGIRLDQRYWRFDNYFSIWSIQTNLSQNWKYRL
jgi:hypothetical protein